MEGGREGGKKGGWLLACLTQTKKSAVGKDSRNKDDKVRTHTKKKKKDGKQERKLFFK